MTDGQTRCLNSSTLVSCNDFEDGGHVYVIFSYQLIVHYGGLIS